MADKYRIEFSLHETRADLLEAVVDMEHVREWARGKGYMPHVARYANHLWEYLQDNPDVPRRITEGELVLEECANLRHEETFDADELEHPHSHTRAPQEFMDKQQSLAMFLLAMATGRTWDDAEGVDSLHPNYIEDAHNFLIDHPHLLSLDARQQMGL